ncbi:MAG: asparagine synthetase B [Gemmatimonadetes bacterium]|nr:asparagine synthetase B [Gemmatimonadota bacterium]
MLKSLRLVTFCTLLLAARASAQQLLVPMDDAQANHLKAYGVAFHALTEGVRAEWLINYRGGAFLLPDVPFLRRRAAIDGVTFEAVSDAAVNAMRTEIADGNADAVPLEKAPRIAVYAPPNSPPWDDAVTLALRYAGIPYTRVWDDEILGQDLAQYDWIHLFHEDFTGQLNKLYLSYRDAPWFIEQRERDLATARRHGHATVPSLKKAVAAKVRAFVERGGFLFAMCGATETLEIALASQGVDIAAPYSDGTPIDPDADTKMDWANGMAIGKAHLEMAAGVNAMSDIDGHQVNVPARRQPLGTFQLFAFSAKLDPVATMLVQGHRSVIPDFYGVTTSFSRRVLRPSVTVLAYEEGAPWVKYVHGDLGKGAWTYLGGHDPEDPQHSIGAPPTDLALHPNSPGYRLILNNVLFPAAKKKPHKT